MQESLDAFALANEVANRNFTDERLTRRLRRIVAGLAADPEASLPRLFDSAGLEAVYRFFSNHRVMPNDILRPHFEATRQRTEGRDFLVVHDTTQFLFRADGEREGLGRVKRSTAMSKQGFFLHASLAVAADGTRRPLGAAAFYTWVRGPERSGTEYQRWEAQIRESSQRLGGLEHAIHVMDREADDYQMFDALVADDIRFVARVLTDRRVETNNVVSKLREVVREQPATVEREVPLTRRKPKTNPQTNKTHPPRDARTAKLAISATSVTLIRPKHVSETSSKPSLELNVVRVWEPHPPEDVEPIEWLLYTTEPVDSPEQQLAIVDHYRARWVIEEFFKAIKTGCSFEARQLEDYEGLVNLLATFVPIAYQCLLLRSEARRTPQAEAKSVLSGDHIEVLRALGRIKLPEHPTARDVYLAVAALGGHIKYNGDPGWRTLAYGFEKLATLTEGWIAAKLQLRRDQ